jgi:hypothetical protein
MRTDDGNLVIVANGDGKITRRLLPQSSAIALDSQREPHGLEVGLRMLAMRT